MRMQVNLLVLALLFPAVPLLAQFGGPAPPSGSLTINDQATGLSSVATVTDANGNVTRQIGMTFPGTRSNLAVATVQTSPLSQVSARGSSQVFLGEGDALLAKKTSNMAIVYSTGGANLENGFSASSTSNGSATFVVNTPLAIANASVQVIAKQEEGTASTSSARITLSRGGTIIQTFHARKGRLLRNVQVQNGDVFQAQTTISSAPVIGKKGTASAVALITIN